MDLDGLPTDLAQFVQQEIAQGKFSTVEEVVSAALRMLREREARGGNGHAISNGMTAQVLETQTSPDDIIRAIKQAFETDKPQLAERLAREGAAHFPEHAELQKYAHVLAPPTAGKLVPTTEEVRAARKANHAWLKAHWPEYRGHWIALRAGQLLHASPSMDELIETVGEIRGREILLTKIA